MTVTNEVLEQKAAQLQKESGGVLFGFPVEEGNPFSSYAVVMWAGGKWHVYPSCVDISTAASGILTIMEQMEKSGYPMDYKRDVRLVSYDAQVNGPNVIMRRLRKEHSLQRPALLEGADVQQIKGEEDNYVFSARGLIKFCYLTMMDDKNLKAAQFMDEYYKLLSMRRYGKTAAAIKQEVRRMTRDEAVKWIERTYSRYIAGDVEIINIFERLKGGV